MNNNGSEIAKQAVSQLVETSFADVIWQQLVDQINKPMGISEYKLTQSLPEALQNSLPSVAELEQLGGEHE